MDLKMISNDLRSSCRAMLIGAYQDGGNTRNSVFHDIIDNSDVVATIPIYGDYKLTVNLWETDRSETYESGFYSLYLTALKSENEGCCQNYYYPSERVVHVVYIAWNGDTPLYAQISGRYSYFLQSFGTVSMYENADTSYPFSYYVYPGSTEKYIKGSAVPTTDIDHFEFEFKTSGSGIRYFNDCIYPCDSSGNHIGLNASYKTKRCTYSPEYAENVVDTTQLPTIKLSSSSDKSNTLYIGNSINLFISGYTGIYSDFDTNEQLVAAHGEIVRGICLANGIEYKMAALLLPESEE